MSVGLPEITAEEFYQSGFASIYKDYEEYEAARLRQNSIITIANEYKNSKKTVENPINKRARKEREELQARYDELKGILRQNETDLRMALREFTIEGTDDSYKKYIDAMDLKSDNNSLANLLLDFIGMRNDTVRRTQA